MTLKGDVVRITPLDAEGNPGDPVTISCPGGRFQIEVWADTGGEFPDYITPGMAMTWPKDRTAWSVGPYQDKEDGEP